MTCMLPIWEMSIYVIWTSWSGDFIYIGWTASTGKNDEDERYNWIAFKANFNLKRMYDIWTWDDAAKIWVTLVFDMLLCIVLII